MYEAFFHLNKRPFAATPDASCCYPSDLVSETLAGLRHCIDAGQGTGILTGGAGTGKTLLCQKLAAELSGQFKTAFVVTGNLPTRRSLIQAILYELGQPYSGMGEQELRLELLSAVRSFVPQFRGTLLILDEAHLLSERLLEEIRIITDFSRGGVPLVRTVLSGQMLLEERLTSPALEALNQRIAGQFCLEELTRQQSLEYIAYRVKWAGGDASRLFSADALELIARASEGSPRCINQLCEHSLLWAFASELRQVNRQTVHDALTELKQLPLQWNTGSLDSASGSEPAIALPTLGHAAPRTQHHQPSTSGLAIDLPVQGTVFEIGEPTVEHDEASRLHRPQQQNEHSGAHPEPLPHPELDRVGADVDVDVEFVAWETDDLASPATRSEPANEAHIVDFSSFTAESQSSRQTTEYVADDAEGVFEELVFDRYAMLDAGRLLSSGVGSSDSKRRRSSLTSQAATAGSGRQSTRDDPTSKPVVADLRERELPVGAPDKLVDIVLSMISEADAECSQREAHAHCCGGCGSSCADETIDSYDMEIQDGEPVQINMSAVETTGASADIEELIGAEVLDLCLETQEVIEQRQIERGSGVVPLADVPPRLEHTIDGVPRVTRFDIVEPEPTANGARAGSDAAGDTSQGVPRTQGAVPHPNYKLIFSTLRRRQKRQV